MEEENIYNAANGSESTSPLGEEDGERDQMESPAVCRRPAPRLIIPPADMEGIFGTYCTAF